MPLSRPPTPPADGKPIPSELRKEEAALRHDVALEDDNTAVPRSHVDDEYARASERDPRPLITTSRDPSSRLVQFAKELKLVFPNSIRINRGGNVSQRMSGGYWDGAGRHVGRPWNAGVGKGSGAGAAPSCFLHLPARQPLGL